MPLSSSTTASVAAHTAHPLMVTRFLRPIAAIVRLGGAGVNGAVLQVTEVALPSISVCHGGAAMRLSERHS